MKKIVHSSDVHFGKEDPTVVESLIEKILEREPDLLVVGDLTSAREQGS